MEILKYSLEFIVGGVNPDGSKMLDTFLKTYSRETGVPLSNLNPSCRNCLTSYYNELLKKNRKMSKQSDYKLKNKFNGLPLAFGSPVLVTNANITNDYAETIISRYLDIYEKKEEEFTPELFFEEFPENWEDAHYSDGGDQNPSQDIGGNLDEETNQGVDGGGLQQDPTNKTQQGLEKKDTELNLKELRAKYPTIKATSIEVFLNKLKEQQRNED